MVLKVKGNENMAIYYRRFSSLASLQQITHATAADIPPKLSNATNRERKKKTQAR